MFYRVIFLLVIHNCLAQEASFEAKRRCPDQTKLEEIDTLLSLSLRGAPFRDFRTQETKSNDRRKSLIEKLVIQMRKSFKPSTINDTDFNFEERSNLGGEYSKLSKQEECPYPELFSKKELLNLKFLSLPANADDDDLINERSIDDDFTDFFLEMMNLRRCLLKYKKDSDTKLEDQESFLKKIMSTTASYDLYLQHYKYYPERKMYGKIHLSEEFKETMKIYINFFNKKFDTILDDICAEHPDYKLKFSLEKNLLMKLMGMVEAMGIEPMSVKLPNEDPTCLVSTNS